uniref:Uncharacterized protein n=1 Tax=Chromera velia CCMP2878 TaxID=1169474 RepID=A0A0G4HQR7_9ALVE|eukprot:Cvel_1274.t1-p1 / transcript=Cvel_1274.t1 / gene=Cvel_1274 / organism=Chromera_velia_CCMP2878 / gene_product=hypothetical protein / transcript_product=hypothetical protein / location=Cvel_scaffold42:160601-163858(-) / protein_length=333 / sequence_SO=supercontig / SO=protein_coding / is_pseudo=false
MSGNVFPAPNWSDISEDEGEESQTLLQKGPGLPGHTPAVKKKDPPLIVFSIKDCFREQFDQIKDELEKMVDAKLAVALASINQTLQKWKEEVVMIFDHLYRHDEQIKQLFAMMKEGGQRLTEEERRLHSRVVLDLLLNRANAHKDLKNFMYQAVVDAEGNRRDSEESAQAFLQKVGRKVKLVRVRVHKVWGGLVVVVFGDESAAEGFDTLFDDERSYTQRSGGSCSSVRDGHDHSCDGGSRATKGVRRTMGQEGERQGDGTGGEGGRKEEGEKEGGGSSHLSSNTPSECSEADIPQAAASNEQKERGERKRKEKGSMVVVWLNCKGAQRGLQL